MIWDESGLLAICGTIVGLGAALLVQCGGNKRAPPKKAITAGSKAKSQRSVRGKKPSTSSKSLKTGKSAKSLRSARSASNKSSRSSKAVKSKVKQTGVKSAKETSKSQLKTASGSSKSASKKSLKMEVSNKTDLKMEPNVLRFDEKGGLQVVKLQNLTGHGVAFKVKTSDNNLYRVNPVFATIGAGETVEVTVLRQNGPSKMDKMIFETIKSANLNIDAKSLFKSASTKEANSMLCLPLMA